MGQVGALADLFPVEPSQHQGSSVMSPPSNNPGGGGGGDPQNLLIVGIGAGVHTSQRPCALLTLDCMPTLQELNHS